jgi:CRISPR-associated protein Csh1
MLDTLLKIGKWQSEDQFESDIDRHLTILKVDNDKEPYHLDIVLDLDNEEITIDAENLSAYDPEKTPKEIVLLRTFTARHQKVYAAIDFDRVHYLKDSLFGDGKKGDLLKHIENNFEPLLSTPLVDYLNIIFDRLKVQEEKIDGNYIKEALDLKATKGKVATIRLVVKHAELNEGKITPLNKIEGFEEFVNLKYLASSGNKGYCYITGEQTDEATVMNIDSRASMLKMFQSTTNNYATTFDKKLLNRNFQTDAATLGDVVAGESYLRTHLRVFIAGQEHYLVPSFPSWAHVDIDLAIDRIGTEKDILFKKSVLRNTLNNYEDWGGSLYWVDFYAKYPDAKSFKTTNIISDVSGHHIFRIIEAFEAVDEEFVSLRKAVNWQNAINTGDNSFDFNFSSIYRVIPVRYNKRGEPLEKRNRALILFKSVLENRQISRQNLFEYFSELMLCHYYGRYAAYKNVNDYTAGGNRKRDDYFIWACRDSVFKYLAFIQVLKRLNLIDMENLQENSEPQKSYGEEVEAFFVRMNYKPEQKAVFYLGRMLNKVAGIQEQDNKKKSVLEKVNFSGMGGAELARLGNSLVEKANQYRTKYPSGLKSVLFYNKLFVNFFNYNDWSMPPQEAVFFLLSGYSYGLVKSETSES